MSELPASTEPATDLAEYREHQARLAAEYVTALAAANLGHEKFSILGEGRMMLGLTEDDFVVGYNRAYEDPRLKYTPVGFEPIGEYMELSEREQKMLSFVQKLMGHETAKKADCQSLVAEIRSMQGLPVEVVS